MQMLETLSVLYIEDEPLIRQNAIEYLSRYCKKVYEADDGISGLQAYEAHKPDIIISDIKMPRLDGLGMARKIREKDKQTPIIIATAHTQTEYLLQAVELQLIKYVIKPITSEKLHGALSMACDALADQLSSSIVTLNPYTNYDLFNKTLVIKSELVKLTHNELLFFDFLVTNHQRAITYEEIESLIWAYEGMSMDSLRSLVRGIRKKLQGDFIENISGVGYRLKQDTKN